jgi:hypothetical protein
LTTRLSPALAAGRRTPLRGHRVVVDVIDEPRLLVEPLVVLVVDLGSSSVSSIKITWV